MSLPASRGRSAGYVALARRLPDPLYEPAARQAIADAFEVTEAAERAEALAGLFELVAEPSREQVMHEALRAAMSIDGVPARARAVAKLTPAVAAAGHTGLINAALQEITMAHYQQMIVQALIPFLPADNVSGMEAWARERDKAFPSGQCGGWPSINPSPGDMS